VKYIALGLLLIFLLSLTHRNVAVVHPFQKTYEYGGTLHSQPPPGAQLWTVTYFSGNQIVFVSAYGCTRSYYLTPEQQYAYQSNGIAPGDTVSLDWQICLY